MEAQQLFGVIVRTVGLLLTVYGLWYLAYAIAGVVKFPEPPPHSPRIWFFGAALWIIVGGALFLNADAVVEFAYSN